MQAQEPTWVKVSMKEDAYTVGNMRQPKFKESMASQDYYGKYLAGSLKDGLRRSQACQIIQSLSNNNEEMYRGWQWHAYDPQSAAVGRSSPANTD